MKKKLFAAICCLTLVASMVVGCGSKAGNHPTGDELNKQLNSIGEAIVSADTTLPEMTVDSSDGADAEINFSAICDFNYKRVAGYYHAYASAGGASEIAIICVNSEDDVNALVNSLKAHIETRRSVMENYTPEQVEIVDKAIVSPTGCYVGLFICEKSGYDKNNFEAELKKNGIQ